MRNKAVSKILLSLVLIELLTLAFGTHVIEAQTATRQAGVSAGYRIYYGLSATWDSNDPDATFPQYILDAQQLAFFYNVVLSVSGTNVTGNQIRHFKNGTEISQTGWIDVETGHAGSTFSPGYLFFVAANLSAGDLIYTGLGAGIGTINDTVTRTYLGQPVEINHSNSTTSSSAYFIQGDIYWNRATGVLYELYLNHTGYTTKGATTYATTETTHIYVIQAPVITIPANVGITPRSLNLRDRGRWITVYIQLPKGYSVKDINVSSILLNGTIRAEPKHAAMRHHDDFAHSALVVRFNRAEVISYILDHIPRRGLSGGRLMTVTLTISGRLNDGTQFNGSSTIKIMIRFHRNSKLHQFLPFFLTHH